MTYSSEDYARLLNEMKVEPWRIPDDIPARDFVAWLTGNWSSFLTSDEDYEAFSMNLMFLSSSLQREAKGSKDVGTYAVIQKSIKGILTDLWKAALKRGSIYSNENALLLVPSMPLEDIMAIAGPDLDKEMFLKNAQIILDQIKSPF